MALTLRLLALLILYQFWNDHDKIQENFVRIGEGRRYLVVYLVLIKDWVSTILSLTDNAV